MRHTLLKISTTLLLLSLSACSFQTSPNQDTTTPQANESSSAQKARVPDSNEITPSTVEPQVTANSTTQARLDVQEIIDTVVTLTDLSSRPGLESTVPYRNEIANAVAQNYNDEFQWHNESPISLQAAITNRLSNAQELQRICADGMCSLNSISLFNGVDTNIAKYADGFLVTWYTNLDGNEDFTHTKTFLAEFSSLNALQAMSNHVHSIDGAWIPTAEHPNLELLQLSEIGYYAVPGYRHCISASCEFKAILIKQNTIIAKMNEVVWAMGRYGGGSKCTIVESDEVLICKSQPYGGTPETIHSVALLK